ncbi:MATE family efflux transporter [Marisediminicola sp. LYQ85]|uniref:MATE family efflux transporter n=1 Tax=Marisediminicola sp. LYQ85 TaxID=3391062 RepID=UPI0039838114
MPRRARNPLDRDIRRLALPALGALIAEPLFLLTDTALVGRLGAVPLAGLGIASAILQTVVGLLVFLAYATTPVVARRLGAGDRPGAIRAGIDGLWLAALVGVVLVAVGLPTAAPLVDAFGASAEVATAATTYLTISVWGLPAMLLVLAATGLLRGLQNTVTPLVIAGAGFAANAVLNAVLIYGFGLGIAGSAIGTIIAQWGMAAVYLAIAVRAARSVGVGLGPGLGGVTSAAASGGWLLVRTASLRAALLATVVVGTGLGVTSLATLQIAMTLFSTLAFALDALAIAGQAMIGHGLGASDVARVKAVTRRLVVLGLWWGAGLGLAVAALAPLAGFVFTTDPGVLAALPPVMLVMGVGVPIAGIVFVLDGVLIGAGDAKYLAITGVANLAVYLPLLALAAATGSITAVWAAFGIGYIAARAVTLGWRARSERWIVAGAG